MAPRSDGRDGAGEETYSAVLVEIEPTPRLIATFADEGAAGLAILDGDAVVGLSRSVRRVSVASGETKARTDIPELVVVVEEAVDGILIGTLHPDGGLGSENSYVYRLSGNTLERTKLHDERFSRLTVAGGHAWAVSHNGTEVRQVSGRASAKAPPGARLGAVRGGGTCLWVRWLTGPPPPAPTKGRDPTVRVGPRVEPSELHCHDPLTGSSRAFLPLPERLLLFTAASGSSLWAVDGDGHVIRYEAA